MGVALWEMDYLGGQVLDKNSWPHVQCILKKESGDEESGYLLPCSSIQPASQAAANHNSDTY